MRSGVRQEKFIAQFVERAAEKDAPLLAGPLRRYAANEGMTWEELAESLGCGVKELNEVALCRPPRRDEFLEDVEAIAGGMVNVDRLVALLRRIQVLGALAEETREALGSGEERQEMLLAARDREETER